MYMQYALTYIYMFTCRTGQINRAILDARDLLKLLQNVRGKMHGDHAVLAGVIQKVNSPVSIDESN